ncbi:MULTISPECIES: SHOCT domain-containing protein [Desulfotignum]
MDSLKILKTRFARGEITEQEYRKMRDILCKNGTSK